MPSLTVKAAAELLRLPAYEQARILYEQKYPRQQPQTFRTPFYSPVLSAIREYYRAGNDTTVLGRARQNIRNIGLQQRRDANLRVLDCFEGSNQAARSLLPSGHPPLRMAIGSVEIRLALDMSASEGSLAKRFYYNPRVVALDGEVARAAIEIAHWLLEQAGFSTPIRNIEYVDLTGGRVFRTRRRRAATIKRLKANARIIEALWPTI
jgi:hypothetical protein